MSPEQYKIQQQARITAFKVGTKDPSGYEIVKIHGRGDEFVIYEIASDNVIEALKVHIDTMAEDDFEPLKRYESIREKFAVIKELLFKAVDVSAVKSILSHILASGITFDPASANAQLDRLISKINVEYEEQFKNKMRLLGSSFICSAVLILTACFIYVNKYFQETPHLYNLIYVMAGGSIGGFFSISLGINKIKCEKDVSSWLYYLYGFQRIVIAVLAGIIMYFAIQSDLVLTAAKNVSSPMLTFIIFSILAGFSETFVPNLLKKIEKPG